ncbi:MAG: hypothetical protein H7338_09295 [Candidatus Sericytochromatia bacterium]|nr:hypothetical protein [Candidatus Sericytochromatia bacterium]
MQSPVALSQFRPMPASVRLPRMAAPIRAGSLHRPSAETAMKAALAEDNFVGRPYAAAGMPAVGRGVDGALRNGKFLGGDLKTLIRAKLNPSVRVAVASKVIAGVDNVAFYGEMTANGVRQATHHAALTPTTFVTGIHRAGALGNIVLARGTLPALAVTTYTKTAEAIRLTRNTDATKQERRNAWRDAAYSNVAMVSMGSGVTGSISTLAAGPLGSPLTRSAMVLTTSDAFRVVNTISKVLAPIADGALLAADFLQLQAQMTGTDATSACKARSFFNVGLGTIKVASHFFPPSTAAKTAYSVVGVVQLGLAGYDQLQARKARQG